ncbi:hypothetical protein AJ79_07577 [Helicocarpus griseus UAMH5409]|uniref:Calcineurin-like phosphoesterase domain-containing protein n=1 Tax=Helicocarpus griseus UAMH5409 TaxID=1447875 RepID=A0A2B7X1X6_9EURO|nr:hypothetical protein AJ79_07577 [Helicocarpus griseus UAMH5409]
MTSIQILSDIHLESPSAYDVFSIPPKAPHLALLGDIGNVRDKGFSPFIEAQLHNFRTVFLLLGNHEPYHSSWPNVRQEIEKFAQNIRLQSEREPVLGCTLHSHIPPESEEQVSFGLNDFSGIDDWTVQEHNAAHAVDLAWLNEQVASISATEPERKIVIFTHHSPAMCEKRAVDPAHANSAIGPGFRAT